MNKKVSPVEEETSTPVEEETPTPVVEVKPVEEATPTPLTKGQRVAFELISRAKG